MAQFQRCEYSEKTFNSKLFAYLCRKFEKMERFDLEGREFIELNKLMKILRWVGTGGEANVHIIQEEVKVNGVTEIQKRKKLRTGDVVSFDRFRVEVI